MVRALHPSDPLLLRSSSMKPFGSAIASVLAGIVFAGTGAAFAAAAQARKGSRGGHFALGLVRILTRGRGR